jgi:alanyl-tRNA synthetase
MFGDRKYIRQKCRVCGEYFWAPIERMDCGDAPCTDYSFFNIKLSVGPLTVKEVRDRFLNFFNKRGHAIIDPKPVVAKWREDLYLTIASIIVFQPHVTSGLVPPPANPLVIAQPCIRLEDIDSVGYTFGRHLTNFIMGGHHAFNYPDNKIYFTDETVEYAREFFIKEIGVPEHELTFKESWWEGGGNAGPSFEVAVGGLEVATLVFMMYDVVDGEYKEMPIKIVDTGYGIERIAWLTQKTPTAFHAIYGDLVKKYHNILEVPEPPNDLLRITVKYVGRLNPKDFSSYQLLKQKVSKELQISLDEVGVFLDNVIKVYTLLDHIKTALLMLSDGVVPSNSGEGYLARLVLRRIFRLLKLMDKQEVLEDLFNLQMSYWSEVYTNIKGKAEYILDVVAHEQRKFADILSKAPAVVRKYITKGSRGLDLDELIELYDSHGIPPELASEIAKKLGIEVETPSDFYAIIASRHSKAPIKKVEKGKLPNEVIKEFKDLPKTRFLFHEDPYVKEFKARVIKAYNRYIALDQTAFYPEGGGQEADTGYFILPNGERIKVVDTQKVGNVVIHITNRELDPDLKDCEITGVVDWSKRYILMRHHTATHIILGAARLVLGDHVWQAGAEKTEQRARLDITHYKQLTKDEITKIEDVANNVVIEGREVKSMYMPRYEAEDRYGFRLYQGGVPMDPVIRVVEIDNLDAEACFGTHLKNTREVGAIKIVNVDRIQDGVIRLEYVAGTQVANYARKLEQLIKDSQKYLGGGELVTRAASVASELKQLRQKLAKYRNAWIKETVEKVIKNAKNLGKVKYYMLIDEIGDQAAVREVLKKAIYVEPNLVIIALMPRDRNTIVEISLGRGATSIINASKLIKELLTPLGGRGGGKADHATGSIPKSLNEVSIEEFNRVAIKLITEMVSKQ